MTKPILIPFCKTRSGKQVQIGPKSEWDRICAAFEDQDYIDLYCVLEKLEVFRKRNPEIEAAFTKDAQNLLPAIVDYFNSHPALNQILPPSLERARIAEELVGALLD